jgi:hypothetical protein
MPSAFEVLGYLLVSGVFIAAVWLLVRWLRRRPAFEWCFGIAACLPLLGIAEHWWHHPVNHPLGFYRSDSLSTHVVLAALQVLSVLAVARLSTVSVNGARLASLRDDRTGVLTACLAGFCGAMFILAYGEHTDLFVPPFPVNTPGWWRTVGWHSWGFWFLTGIGLLLSARAMRRGRASGYVGAALVASFVALMHYDTFLLGDQALGATPGSVALILSVSGLCWILACHRLLTRNPSA